MQKKRDIKRAGKAEAGISAQDKLKQGKFRYLNEQLYTTPST